MLVPNATRRLSFQTLEDRKLLAIATVPVPIADAVTESGFVTSYVSANGQAELILDGTVNGPGATASSVVFPVSGLPSGLISGSVIIDTQGYTYYGKGFHGAYGSSEYVDLGGVPIASFTNDGPKVWDYFPQNAAAGSQYITIPFNDMVVVNQELVIGVSANAAVDFFDATIAITSVNQAPPANQNPVSLSPTAEAAGTGTSPVRGSQVTAVDSSMASGPEYRLEGRMIEKLGPTGYEPYPILGVDDGPVGESALYNGNAHDLALLAGLGVDMVFFYNTLPATGQSLTVLNNLAAKGISVVMPVDLPFGDVASDFSSAPATLNFFKDDPTIIWTVNKNEWDLNALSDQLASQAVYTNWAAAQVKALDPGSLVFTALADPAVRPLFTSEGGDAMSTQQLLALMPAVDGFLFSSYRGDTLNGIVDELAALTDKPVGLGEYGEDSYTHGLSGQAQVDQSLTHEVVSNLAVSGGVLVGAFLFELPFESWKAPGAEQSYSLIDGAGNPKPAYYTVQQIYTQFFALSIASASVVVSAGQLAVGSTGQSLSVPGATASAQSGSRPVAPSSSITAQVPPASALPFIPASGAARVSQPGPAPVPRSNATGSLPSAAIPVPPSKPISAEVPAKRLQPLSVPVATVSEPSASGPVASPPSIPAQIPPALPVTFARGTARVSQPGAASVPRSSATGRLPSGAITAPLSKPISGEVPAKPLPVSTFAASGVPRVSNDASGPSPAGDAPFVRAIRPAFNARYVDATVSRGLVIPVNMQASPSLCSAAAVPAGGAGWNPMSLAFASPPLFGVFPNAGSSAARGSVSGPGPLPLLAARAVPAGWPSSLGRLIGASSASLPAAAALGNDQVLASLALALSSPLFTVFVEARSSGGWGSVDGREPLPAVAAIVAPAERMPSPGNPDGEYSASLAAAASSIDQVLASLALAPPPAASAVAPAARALSVPNATSVACARPAVPLYPPRAVWVALACRRFRSGAAVCGAGLPPITRPRLLAWQNVRRRVRRAMRALCSCIFIAAGTCMTAYSKAARRLRRRILERRDVTGADTAPNGQKRSLTLCFGRRRRPTGGAVTSAAC